MIYVIGLFLVFVGFCFGFFLAAICTASGRAARSEEDTLRRHIYQDYERK